MAEDERSGTAEDEATCPSWVPDEAALGLGLACEAALGRSGADPGERLNPSNGTLTPDSRSSGHGNDCVPGGGIQDAARCRCGERGMRSSVLSRAGGMWKPADRGERGERGERDERGGGERDESGAFR